MPFSERIEEIYSLLCGIQAPDSTEKPEGWSIKQVVGHLIDSCSNNHQRLARYVSGATLEFPSYNQNEFVSRMGYASLRYNDIVTLWYRYNKAINNLYSNIPETDRTNSFVKVGDKDPMSLQTSFEFYMQHIEIHLKQINRIIDVYQNEENNQ